MREELCHKCGKDLSNIQGHICPDCGTDNYDYVSSDDDTLDDETFWSKQIKPTTMALGIGTVQGKFIYFGDLRYYMTEDPIMSGDAFIELPEDKKIPIVMFHECEGKSSDGTKLIRKCYCGKCKPENNFIPAERCKRIVPSPIELN